MILNILFLWISYYWFMMPESLTDINDNLLADLNIFLQVVGL